VVQVASASVQRNEETAGPARRAVLLAAEEMEKIKAVKALAKHSPFV
jgi:hypothetical protein